MRCALTLLSLLLWLLLASREAAARALLDPYRPGGDIGGERFVLPSEIGEPSRDEPPIPLEIERGFAVGPNLYAYVQQNPWTKFDPEGLYWFTDKYSEIPSVLGDLAGQAGGLAGRVVDGLWNKLIASTLSGGNPQGMKMLASPVYRITGFRGGEALYSYAVEHGQEAFDNNAQVTIGHSGKTGPLSNLKELKSAAGPQIEAGSAPKGSANSDTKAAAARGTQLHVDKPGNLPGQLREMYPDTTFAFTKPGQPGQDVKVAGGKHPSEYPKSKWPEGLNYGDFKPDTSGGRKTFQQDQKNKWKDPTYMLPYDPKDGTLK